MHPPIYFDPGTGSRYRAMAAPIDGRPNTILFCFGIGDRPMAAYLAFRDTEPDSFGYFCEKWDSTGVGGNTIDLWVGFLALRHILGYPTTWEALPERVRRAAVREGWGDPQDWLSFPGRMARFCPDWRDELAPLVAALEVGQ